jgi:hypothetical protein
MPKFTILSLIFIGIIALASLLVNREMNEAQARPAVQRQLSQTRLTQFIDAIKLYRNQHQQWPANMRDILRAGQLPLSSTAVRGAGVYRYQPPSESLSEQPGEPAPANTIIVWSDRPYDPIKKGEPFGGEGQIAEHDIPPLAYVINAALEIEHLSPEEWAKRIPKTASAAPNDAP